MSRSLEPGPALPPAWCGRSWEGLLDRRCEAWEHALALGGARHEDARRVLSGFLAFFDPTGAALMRDEEEWIFRSLRPTPSAVIRARDEHSAIASSIRGLVGKSPKGDVDLAVVHGLGRMLEGHLLMEEKEIRPLTRRRSFLTAGH